jgi:hypothetical protein
MKGPGWPTTPPPTNRSKNRPRTSPARSLRATSRTSPPRRSRPSAGRSRRPRPPPGRTAPSRCRCRICRSARGPPPPTRSACSPTSTSTSRSNSGGRACCSRTCSSSATGRGRRTRQTRRRPGRRLRQRAGTGRPRRSARAQRQLLRAHQRDPQPGRRPLPRIQGGLTPNPHDPHEVSLPVTEGERTHAVRSTVIFTPGRRHACSTPHSCCRCLVGRAGPGRSRTAVE